MTFSNNLEKELSTDMGLQSETQDLSPFLNKGFTIPYFRQSGKIPKDIDLLQISVRGELIKEELIFNILVDIPT
jgi:hypothetical protein